MSSRRWSGTTKLTVGIILALLAIILLVTFRVLIAPTIVAFLLAFILSYPVNWIQRTSGWPRGLSVAVVYVVLLAVLALTPIFIVPRLVDMVESLRGTLQDLVDDLQSAGSGPLLSFGDFSLSLDVLFQQTGELLGSVLITAGGNPISLARGVTNSIITVIYVLVVAFWILKDIYRLQRLIIDQIPVDYQEDVRRLGQELGQIWHAFLRGQLTLAITVGVLVWIILSIVGMPNAGGLALLAGLMEFLPTIGPAVSGTVGTFFAFFQGSTWMPVHPLTFAIIVGLLYAIIGQIESIYLIPRLVGGRVRLHPAVAFVGIIAGTLVFGLLGVLLATPLLASSRTILSYVFRKLLDREPFEPSRSAQASVRIPGLIAGRKIEAVVFDLDGVLAEIDWSAPAWAESHLRWMDRVIPPETRAAAMRRIMVAWEGILNFLVGQYRDAYKGQGLDRRLPWINRLRGYAPVQEMRPIPGVRQTLTSLAASYRLALVSTRRRSEIDSFLHQNGLDPALFAAIVGREATRNLLPNSEPLRAIIEALGTSPAQMLMVSDTDSNLRSARAMEMATVGVLCGLGQEKDFADTDLVIATTAELTDWL